MIPIYTYEKSKGDIKYFIQLYEYIEVENGVNIYYTVCCMFGEGNELYEHPVIVRLLTDIIKTSSIVGNIPSSYLPNLVRKSYRRDNKWQREASERINNVVITFEQRI